MDLNRSKTTQRERIFLSHISLFSSTNGGNTAKGGVEPNSVPRAASSLFLKTKTQKEKNKTF